MLKIDEVFLFVAEDDTGEGIIGELMGDNWVPFVCADLARVNQLRPRAELIAKTTKKKVKLIRYSTRTEMEVIEGAVNGNTF